MSEERSSAFLVTITICVVITMLSLEVDAQSTVDDSASCVSSTFCDQCDAVNLIRDVKNLLGPNQQQNDESSISRKDFEDLKAACASNQQQNNASCISFEDLKAACASNQQQCPSPPTAPSSSNQALISSFICEYMSHVIQFCADRSPFSSYLTLNNIVTLKSGLEVTQCH